MKPTNQDVQIYAETNITTTGDGWRLVANCGGYQSNRRGENVYEENVANAKLIAALWNMARALNPADPLAAANALPDVVAALETIADSFDGDLAGIGGGTLVSIPLQKIKDAKQAIAALKGGAQ